MADDEVSQEFWTPEEALDFFCPDIGPEGEMPPQLVLFDEDGLTMCMLDPTGAPGMQEMLTMTFMVLFKDREQLPLGVIFASEAYARVYPDQETMRSHTPHPGSLADAFRLGDEFVKEVLMITGVASGGSVWSASRAFRRVEGTVEWDEPVISTIADGKIAGGIPDLLLAAVR